MAASGRSGVRMERGGRCSGPAPRKRVRDYGAMGPQDRRSAAHEDLVHTGLRDAPVEIVEYDPGWPAAYVAERERLAPLLGDGVELHHFGSTAVPGLAAKPVIDMIALVDDIEAPIAALVQRGGYQYPRRTTRRSPTGGSCAIRRAPTAPTTCTSWTGPSSLERRLRFRDRLRAERTLADEYVALKRALAERYRDDREAYTEAKGEFIRREQASG